MKSIIFLFLFLFVPKIVNSQITNNDEISYIDSLGQYGTFENYKYIRVIKDFKNPNVDVYQLKEYYKSGKIALSGTINSAEKKTKVGSFTYFYESGTKKSIDIYKDGFVQTRYDFYENGAKKLVTDFEATTFHLSNSIKISQFWNEKGEHKVIDGNGFLEINDKNEPEKGEIKNGLKNGLWEGHQHDVSYKETYDNGKLISGISTDKTFVSYAYTEREVKPTPVKGMENFYQHVGKNFNIPNIEGLRGKVYVAFVVEIDGSLTNFKILKDLGYGTGDEAIRVIKNYKAWRPGEQRGRKVRCTFSLPISIQSSN
jgi:hypothetical protein